MNSIGTREGYCYFRRMTMSPKFLKSLVLVGMPGSGKTSVGAALARLAGLPFVDVDSLIEQQQGRSIPEIFAAEGEAAFRAIEAEAVASLLEGPPQVIATGGGAFIQPGNHALIQGRAVSIWLHTDLETLFARTSRRTNRPLLQGDDPRARLAALLETRGRVYATAHLAVDVDDRPVEETAANVFKAVTLYLEQAA